MDYAEKALDTLDRIQQLWIELERTRSDNPEYHAIIGKIRILSAEYQKLIDKKRVE